MSIKFINLNDVYTVNKPWGYEKWIANGIPNFKYVLKEILFHASFRSSIQFHEKKEETNYVVKGKGVLYYSDTPIDLKKFKNGEYSDDDLKIIINTLKKVELTPGIVIHIKPGIVHRIEAIDDLLLIEASTVELDDVFRLQDDSERQHGRIEKEHSQN